MMWTPAIGRTGARLRPLDGLLALVAVGALATTSPAQTVDAGELVILSGTTVVGHEEFAVRRGRSAGTGLTVTTTAFYPAARPVVTISAALELGPDSLPAAAQFDVTGPDQRRVYVVLGSRRVTVRTVRPRAEAAREYPSATPYLLLDDSVFAFHALLPRTAAGAAAVLAPRHERRDTGSVTWEGSDRTQLGGVVHTLTRVTIRMGARTRTVWYDGAGRLMKVEDQYTGLVAERQEGPRPQQNR
jgi:hypothetical protein